MTLTPRQVVAWSRQVDAEAATRHAFDVAVERIVDELRQRPDQRSWDRRSGGTEGMA